MIEREATGIVHESMVAEQAASRIAYQHVAIPSGPTQGGLPEYCIRPHHLGPGTCDRQTLLRDLLPRTVMQQEHRIRLSVPGRRCRIDQHREAPTPCITELEEQPRAQPGRWPAIGLRFVPIGHHRVEDMRSEA